MSKREPKSLYRKIYAVVKKIPRGRVATYGQIAALAGLPRHARQVGYALSALPDESSLPWHRVINAEGRISLRQEPGCHLLQKHLLAAEGVIFDSAQRISLEEFQWNPRFVHK